MKRMMTPRQREVLRLILLLSLTQGRPPTVRELMNRLGLASLNGVMCHIRLLARKGFVQRCPNARGLRVCGVAMIPTFDQSQAGRIAKEIVEEIEAGDDETVLSRTA